MKAWITRYALTTGILEVEGTKHSEDMFEYKVPESSFIDWAHGNDWHETKEAAIAHADVMRIRKIKSLERSIEKLKKLRFEV